VWRFKEDRMVGEQGADPFRFVEKHSQRTAAELQIPPLRCAPVGMTKGRAALPFKFDAADDEQKFPPLPYPGFPVEVGGVVAPHPVKRGRKSGYAPAEMTMLFG
jgi:hypothetical protein